MAPCHAMICHQVTLSGDAEWPKVADAVIEARDDNHDSWNGYTSKKSQIPPDLVVKPQVTDIIDIILPLIRRPNGVYRACRKRKSKGALLSTSAVQWATTKFDGV